MRSATSRLRLVPLCLAALIQACASAGPPPPPPPPDPSGVYDCTISFEGGQLAATMTIRKEEGKYVGTIASDMGTVGLMNLAVEGKQMTFDVDPGGMVVSFKVGFDDTGLQGTFQGGGMTGLITGKKRQG